MHIVGIKYGLKSMPGFLVCLCCLIWPWDSWAATASAETGERSITLTILEIGGRQAAEQASVAIDAEEPLSWRMYVPKNYSPELPAGLMVYIPPIMHGGILPKWKEVMEESNMIWIAADRSGNEIPVARRSILAIMAPEVAKRDYRIDDERVYLSGFSGGGKVASMIAPGATRVYKGAIYIGGVEFFENYPHDSLEAINQNHYVFLTGTEDFNERLTRRIYGKYKQAGIRNIKLMVIGRMGHRLPGVKDFTKAIQFLDSRVIKAN